MRNGSEQTEAKRLDPERIQEFPLLRKPLHDFLCLSQLWTAALLLAWLPWRTLISRWRKTRADKLEQKGKMMATRHNTETNGFGDWWQECFRREGCYSFSFPKVPPPPAQDRGTGIGSHFSSLGLLGFVWRQNISQRCQSIFTTQKCLNSSYWLTFSPFVGFYSKWMWFWTPQCVCEGVRGAPPV